MSNIKLIRMSSGEDVVAEVMLEDSKTLQLTNAIVAIPTGNGQLGFAPWSPILSKEEKTIDVAKQFVVYQAEPDSSVVEQYNAMFGNVIAPKNKSIII
jgi:hypothetical protein